ncbi:MAG TPA: hypothetical protein VLA52_05580 [Thermohalobaculum sp.]|nr:hypothetical protein [Thermohalobaculum sp.]
MRILPGILSGAALMLLLAACATAPAGPEPDPAPRSTSLTLELSGKADVVASPGEAIPVELVREGAEPLKLDFQDGTPTRHDLPPGQYGIAGIGPLSCTGLGFEVPDGTGPVDLGTLEARVAVTDYYIAKLKRRPPVPADLTPPGTEPGRLIVGRYALCHAPRDFTGPVWADLPLEQKLMFGVLMAGFCAAAVASGNICAF